MEQHFTIAIETARSIYLGPDRTIEIEHLTTLGMLIIQVMDYGRRIKYAQVEVQVLETLGVSITVRSVAAHGQAATVRPYAMGFEAAIQIAEEIERAFVSAR